MGYENYFIYSYIYGTGLLPAPLSFLFFLLFVSPTPYGFLLLDPVDECDAMLLLLSMYFFFLLLHEER